MTSRQRQRTIRLRNDELFSTWCRALESRHLAHLTFPEVRRGVQALSALYVRRKKPSVNLALTTRGKQAAFGLFYGPLHFLLLERIFEELDAFERPVDRICDLGCGTGVGGVAWALQIQRGVSLIGVEKHPWAAKEARWTYREFGVRGRIRKADMQEVDLPGHGGAILLSFAVNELADRERKRLRERLLEAGQRGATVLIVEPIARPLTPWWDAWSRDFLRAGGSAREWRFPVQLPHTLRLMDRAAGLDHRVLTCRTLWLPGRPESRRRAKNAT